MYIWSNPIPLRKSAKRASMRRSAVEVDIIMVSHWPQISTSTCPYKHMHSSVSLSLTHILSLFLALSTLIRVDKGSLCIKICLPPMWFLYCLMAKVQVWWITAGSCVIAKCHHSLESGFMVGYCYFQMVRQPQGQLMRLMNVFGTGGKRA